MKTLHNHNRIGIWGFGKVGKSVANYLHAQGYQLSIMDRRQPTPQEQADLREKNITWYNENEQETFFYSCDHIIPSPGINITPSRYATHMHKWLPELDLFYHYFHKPIIAVTGSIGKTSVVSILGELFKELSMPVAIGGNIGTPTFDLIAQQDNVDYALLEVSSFQLMHCTQFAPQVSIWTNFYPNHLDYHATEQEYFLAKQKILDHQKNNAFSLMPWNLRLKVPYTHSQHMCSYFTVVLPNSEELKTLCNNESVYYIQNNNFMRFAQETHTCLMQINPALTNLSFIDNILLIAAVCDVMNIDNCALDSIAQKFKLPDHRMEFIESIHNVDFYNDSKATTTASTLAAVEKFNHRPLHLFLGGLSKGVDRSPFIAQLKNKVKHIYCFGKEADTLYNMCIDNEISATHYINLDVAVASCVTTIESNDCVLLSPAGSSYDLYENYEQRGNHFKELIKQHIRKV